MNIVDLRNHMFRYICRKIENGVDVYTMGGRCNLTYGVGFVLNLQKSMKAPKNV